MRIIHIIITMKGDLRMSFKENCGIHFFIDYENVGNSGLEGVQYLENADMVSIFYSKSCEGIQKKYIETQALHRLLSLPALPA